VGNFYVLDDKNLVTMEALEIKREVEVLSDRLGKAQDYL
jgi:hypothetical protein